MPAVFLADLFPNNWEWSKSLLHHHLEHKSTWDISKDWTSLRKSYNKTCINKALCSSILRWKVRKSGLKGRSSWIQDSSSLGEDEATDLLSAPERWKTSIWASLEELKHWVGVFCNQLISRRCQQVPNSSRAALEVRSPPWRVNCCCREPELSSWALTVVEHEY